MKDRLKLILSLTVSLLPLNILRVLAYRVLFNYQLQGAKIGWFTLINIEKLTIKNASIGSFTFCSGPMRLTMLSGSSIGSLNYIKCGKWATAFSSKRHFFIDENVTITTQHLFDVFGEIRIGKGSFIAGVRSQFWTHGGMSDEVDIIIGEECYIGSGVKFTPGTKLAPKTLCAIGSVVTKEFNESNILIAGVPAKKIKENINWRENWK
jgi:acetyltransferase-like isoleucine patch superfamily enzyme